MSSVPAMQPAEAEFLLRFLLPQLASEQTVTYRILSTIPPYRGDYRPHPKSMTALQLAWHIAAVEMWFLDAVIRQRFGETEAKPEGLATGRDIAEWYGSSFAKRRELLESMRGEELAAPVDFIGLSNDPGVAYLNIAIRHSAHHRGQLSTYLRAMGAKVPAIYVESADEPYPSEPQSPDPENAAAGEQARPPAF